MLDTGFEAYKARKRFANLDGLRFFCIFFVLWHHAPAIDTSQFTLLARGFLGVDFFFVLSGYLITTLLLREAETYGSFSLKNFYIRRAIRIIPVYFFVVSIVALYYIGVKGQTDYLGHLPYYYLFLSNFLTDHIPTLSPTWSLSVEEQFYLIWPLLLMLLPKRLVVPVGIALIAVNLAGIMGLLGGTPIPFDLLLIKLPSSTYAPLIMGALLAYLLNNRDSFHALATVFGGRWTALGFTALLLVLVHFLPSDLRGLPNFAIHLTMTAILAALVIREDSIGYQILQSSPIVRFGAVSYGIYLYHLLALDVTNRVAGMLDVTNGWALLIAYSLLSYLVAEISFRTLEAYFHRFRPGSPTQPQ